MTFVLDASVTLCWILPDQSTSASFDNLDRAKNEEVVVPPLWHIEMANNLGLKLRKGVLDRAALAKAIELLTHLNVTTSASIWASPTSLIDSMEQYGLTAYDAEYLQLAIRRNLPVATFDKELIAAAKQAGVELVS